MSDPKPKKLFTGKLSSGVCVELRVADVLALRPDWDEAGAAHFLQVCADHLGAAMLRAGTFELALLLKTAEHLATREGKSDES